MAKHEQTSTFDAEDSVGSDLQKVLLTLSECVFMQINSGDRDQEVSAQFGVWDHFQQCCLEVIIFILFIYFLKTMLLFDVFGGGPIAMLINSVTISRYGFSGFSSNSSEFFSGNWKVMITTKKKEARKKYQTVVNPGEIS